jgi:hypothetical protein
VHARYLYYMEVVLVIGTVPDVSVVRLLSRGKNRSVRSDHQTGRFPINTVKSCKIKITPHGLMAYNY